MTTDQTSPADATQDIMASRLQLHATVGSHEQFVERFDDYLRAIYPSDRQGKFVANLVQGLRTRSARRILDCSAGTGFPSLGIKREAPDEFEIHCCDGDDKMIAVFEKAAAGHGFGHQAMAPPRTNCLSSRDRLNSLLLNWADLDQLDDQYDYVLCRGNSLVYADTWDGSGRVASEGALLDYLRQMIRRVRPGGYLHVDAPKTTGLVRTLCRTLGAETLLIEEEVRVEADRRRWAVTFRRGGEKPISFVRFSSMLTIDRLQSVLENLGLEETEQIDIPGERPDYGVIIARRPERSLASRESNQGQRDTRSDGDAAVVDQPGFSELGGDE